MAGIAEAMSRMTGGGSRHSGISEAMERPERGREPEAKHEGSVPEHLKALHAESGGKHMHVHQHEGGLTSHHVKDDGKVEGPHDHENTEALKEHMSKFFDEEEHEPGTGHDDHDGLM